MTYEEITKKTTEIVKNGTYKTGDVFQEMYNFWMYVVKVNEDKIVTIEGTGDQILKLDLCVYTKEELNRRLRYNNVSDKCWIDYQRNDINFTNDLIDKYIHAVNQSKDIEKIRDMNINLVLC